MSVSAPHHLWLLPARAAAAALEKTEAACGGPLSALAALFNAAVGHDTDPHAALALMVSAAAAGAGAAEGGAAAVHLAAGGNARCSKRQVRGWGADAAACLPHQSIKIRMVALQPAFLGRWHSRLRYGVPH